MPKQIVDIRDFLQKARRKDAKKVPFKRERPGKGPSEAAAGAKRQTNWRVWVIGGTGARPESPKIAAVSRL